MSTQATTLDVTLVGTTTQMAICHLRPNQTVYCEAGKFLFSSGDVVMETKMSAPGQGGGGGAGGFLRTALQAGQRMIAGESFAYQHLHTPGGDGLLGLAGVLPGELRAIQLDGSTSWTAERDAFVAAEEGVDFGIAFSGIKSGLFGGEGFVLQKFSGRGTLIIGGAGDFIDINPADYGGMIKVDTGCIVAWDQNIRYDIARVGRLNRQGVMQAMFGGEGLTLATLQGDGRVILQSVTIGAFARSLAKHMPPGERGGSGGGGGGGNPLGGLGGFLGGRQND